MKLLSWGFTKSYTLAMASPARFLFSVAICLLLLPDQAGATIELGVQKLKTLSAERSSELQIAKSQAELKSFALWTAWTKWIPHLDLQLTQSRSKDYSLVQSNSLGPTGAALFKPTEQDTSKWSLNLTLPIYRRAVHVGVLQSIEENRLAQDQLAVKLSEHDDHLRLFLGNYLLQGYREATIQNSIDIAIKDLKDAELRFNLGQKTKMDVLRTQANLANLQSKQISLHEAKVSDLNRLLEYTGLTLSEIEAQGFNPGNTSEQGWLDLIDPFTQVDEALHKLDPYLKEIRVTLEETSPKYRTLLGETSIANRQAQSLFAGEFPTLDFQASLYKQGADWSQATSSGNHSYSLAVVLTLPLFSGGSLYSNYREKEAALQTSTLKGDQAILQFKNELETQRIRIKSLQQLLASQELSKNQNEELVKLTQKSYQLGKSTLIELLNSQNDLIESKAATARTKIDLAVLVRQYASNLGVTLP